MKKIKLLTSLGVLASLPMMSITSCSKDSKTVVQSNTLINNLNYFASEVSVSTIYKNTEFSFSFSLNDNCYVDYEESYIRCGYNHSISLDSTNFIKCAIDGNRYTFTVDKDLVTGEFVNIYIHAYKTHNLDVSQTSSEISFILKPTPIEKERYTIGFSVPANKGLDFNNSVVSVGSTTLTPPEYIAFEQEYEDQKLTFLSIPSRYVKGDITLKLNVASSTTTQIVARPEYASYYLSNPVVGNDFYCYYEVANRYSYDLDTSLATIKSGDTVLTPDTDYSFIQSSHSGITYLKINGSKIEANKKIYIDVPVVEIYNCYACEYSQNPTVAVIGDSFKKNKADYKFTVIPLNDKTVDWDNADTYIKVGDKKLTKGASLASGTFTVATDAETGYEVVTVAQADTIDDMYCHFITK